MEILELTFKKTSEEIDSANYNHVDLSDKKNLESIVKYVLPVIAENEGWGTKHLTVDKFLENPFQYQADLDASLFANVHVALDGNKNSVALLEYLEETFDKPVSAARMKHIKDLVEDKAKWSPLLKENIITQKFLDKFFPLLKNYLGNKKIYSEIGIVVKPELQGKKSGVTESLYKLFNNGIVFGWTSNPLYIAQCRKYFNKTLFFPLLNEEVNDIEGLASLAILYGDLLTYSDDRLKDLDFGALRSPYFVSDRDKHYLKLSKDLVTAGKISQVDAKRIEYCIEKKEVQGAVVSFN